MKQGDLLAELLGVWMATRDTTAPLADQYSTDFGKQPFVKEEALISLYFGFTFV